MTDYRVRVATVADQDVLVHHRITMFQDMGLQFDATAIGDAFRSWLIPQLTAGTFRAWVIEDAATGIVAAGGALSILPWPPGPGYGSRVAFVYNVYTEPAHRQRGLARQVMNTIHDFCRAAGIRSVVLNASKFGQPLYEDMGYAVAASPMMFLALE